MMCNHNAGERTLSEITSLLLETGWEVQEVHQFHESWLPQIVAIPSATYQGIADASPTKTLYDIEASPMMDTSAAGLMKFDEREDCRAISSIVERNCAARAVPDCTGIPTNEVQES